MAFGSVTVIFRLLLMSIVESRDGSVPQTWITVFEVPVVLEYQFPSPRIADVTVVTVAVIPRRTPR